jgi:oligopeptide transport system substrate-binding protein
MVIRGLLATALAATLLAGCEQHPTGPIVVSAIGGEAKLVNPNLEELSPASAYLISAVAQGLVRFDATGQIEPALAQSWIVSDDGLRYTFRIGRSEWGDGRPITAEQVTARLRAALSRASTNPLKPQLGVIAEIETMTDSVLEISLKAPRPNFLQLLAQPEMAILRSGDGAGPYRMQVQADGAIVLSAQNLEEEADEDLPPDVLLRGERAAKAVARFASGGADLVIGGTAGDLPIARAADVAAAFRTDPAVGLFGLAFLRRERATANPAVRRALAMALDREAWVESVALPTLSPKLSIVTRAPGAAASTAVPDWTALTLPERRAQARLAIASVDGETPARVRVEMPPGPGYRLLFALLRRDWRAIGVEAELAERGEPADLRLIDRVAPVTLASWYMRSFSCGSETLCVPEADRLVEAARSPVDEAERQALLGAADRLLTDAAIFIPISEPLRWSLVSQRLSGWQPNPFARHMPASLIAPRP